MGSLPVLKPREAVRVLERLGFVQVRQRGSHRQFRHPDGRQTTVPDHSSRDLSPIILRQIIKDIGLTPDAFLDQR
jgi:predicted RNA binding protein YcfA (HicA-like mRNA interferase family)